jgi:drug/metabolite transporter (DMT)-like permease
MRSANKIAYSAAAFAAAATGTPLLGIAASVVLVGEPVTWPLVLGTMLVIAGIAIVIVERAK